VFEGTADSFYLRIVDVFGQKKPNFFESFSVLLFRYVYTRLRYSASTDVVTEYYVIYRVCLCLTVWLRNLTK